MLAMLGHSSFLFSSKHPLPFLTQLSAVLCLPQDSRYLSVTGHRAALHSFCTSAPHRGRASLEAGPSFPMSRAAGSSLGCISLGCRAGVWLKHRSGTSSTMQAAPAGGSTVHSRCLRLPLSPLRDHLSGPSRLFMLAEWMDVNCCPAVVSIHFS